jgi:hypothetical protein
MVNYIIDSACQKSHRSGDFFDIIDMVIKMLEKAEGKRYEVKWACLESLVPTGHLLRKIEKAVDFNEIYPMVEHLYSKDNGRPRQ